MIQTKTSIVYGDRSEREGIILVEIRPVEVRLDGTVYLVNDWDVTNPGTDPVHSKTAFRSKEELDQIDAYLESINDFSEMTRSEKEWKKMQLGLLLDTKTNLFPSGKTIYRQMPDDWELSSDEIIFI